MHVFAKLFGASMHSNDTSTILGSVSFKILPESEKTDGLSIHAHSTEEKQDAPRL